MSTGKVECNACPVLCQISDGRTGACDRYANHDGVLVRVDPVRAAAPRRWPATRRRWCPSRGPAAEPRAAEAEPDWNGDLLHADEVFVTGVGSSTTYPDYKPAPFIVASQGAGRRHGHGRHRGHLQLLQLQGEDRHRPLPRRRAGQRALPRRGGGPRHHGRVRLADAVARRRAPPHRRQQEGRPHDGRADAAARQQAGRSRCIIDGGAQHGDPGRPRAHRQRRRRAAHARGLRLGRRRHLRAPVLRPGRRGGGGRRPHHRRAHRAPGRPLPRHAALGHPDARAQVDAGALLPGGQPGHRLGRHRHRRSAVDHRGLGRRAWRGPACAC